MQVEDVFRQVADGNKYAIKDLEAKLTSQLNALVALVREKLSSHARKKVNTLLIIDVHARDIVDGFVRESILNAKEFAWESQLRFYWDRDVDDCIIRQCTGKFSYGYEYMGMNGRLVITPLTDRCYMTLTQALTFKLGGAPAGPAGTGKTETTKDLAKSLALPCFVINCGEGLDYKVHMLFDYVGCYCVYSLRKARPPPKRNTSSGCLTLIFCRNCLGSSSPDTSLRVVGHPPTRVANTIR